MSVYVPFAEGALGKGETKELGEFSVGMRFPDDPKWHKSSVPSA